MDITKWLGGDKMQLIYWILIALLTLFILIGIKDGISTFFGMWFEYGFKFAALTAILISLIIAPSIIKQFVPEYYDYSIGVLIGYIILLAYLRLNTKKHEEYKIED